MQATRDPQAAYLTAWQELAQRIQQGQSFSGRERNCCFLNTGTSRFADVSSAVGLDQIDDSRAVALVDWDHDGDLDLWESNRTGPRVRYLQNNAASDQQFVEVSLRGDPRQRCPSDAIGARVELVTTDEQGQTQTQIRTLSAGDSFVSQSSKIVHFGFPAGHQITSLRVRWPGQSAFAAWQDVPANKRLRLTMGQPQAEIIAPRSVAVELADKPFVAEESPANSRLWFSAPPEAGQLSFSRWDGAPGIREARRAEALLVVCWASWCAPCLQELQLLQTHFSELQAAGVDILALSVDALGEDAEQHVADARTIAEASNWSFSSGLATRELIEQLDALRRDAIYRQDPLPVPASFLVDRTGKLRAVYAGPVEVRQLREDVAAAATAGEQENLARAVPFAGRWAEPLFVTHPLAIANIYREERQFADARDYLLRHLKLESPPPASDTSTAASAARRRLADVHHLLGRIDLETQQEADARDEFRQALSLNPNHLESLLDSADLEVAANQLQIADELLQRAVGQSRVDPRAANKLGLVRLKQGRAADAKRQFELALKTQPSYFPAANNLAWLLATGTDDQVRNGGQALKIAEALVRRIGPRPDLLDTLAAAYAETGDFSKAVVVAEAAVKSAHASRNSTLAIEIETRLQLYRQRQAYRDAAASN
ncbi:MAG: ASPIC/UnbV domain-containing protein [Planctomycetales bacterium]|nr:ASPIC/UnbV domain-containing protein [Planctomycetales bacterium]